MRLREYVDFPREMPGAEYESVVDRLLARLREDESIAGVWQFGSEAPIPGISDIDIQLVIRDGASAVRVPELAVQEPQTSYVLRHGFPHPVPERLVGSLPLLVGPSITRSMRALDGSRCRIPVEAYTAAVPRPVEWFHLFRFVSKLLIRHHQLMRAPTIPIRGALAFLNGTHHSAEIASVVLDVDSRGDGAEEVAGIFAGDVTQLRQTWFDSEERDRLLKLETLLGNSSLLLENILRRFHHTLSREFVDLDPHDVLAFENGGSTKITFAAGTSDAYVRETAGIESFLGRRQTQHEVVVPGVFGHLYLPFLSASGRLSQLIASCTKIELAHARPSEPSLLDLVDAWNEYYEWLGHIRGIQHQLFGFTGRRSERFIYQVRRQVRRFRRKKIASTHWVIQ